MGLAIFLPSITSRYLATIFADVVAGERRLDWESIVMEDGPNTFGDQSSGVSNNAMPPLIYVARGILILRTVSSL